MKLRNLLIAVVVLCSAALAQTPQGFTLQFQNGGTNVTGGTFVKYAKINFASGCTSTFSGGALNITCTGGAGNPGGSANQIQYNLGGTGFNGFTMSGDCTITVATGVVICTKTNGTAFATVATSGSASDLSVGTLAVARGGTGTGTGPSSGQVLVGNAGGTAYAAATMAGDCTMASTGTITCTKTSGTAFGTLATATTASPVIALFSTCSGTQYLGADAACHTASTGTVTTTGSPSSGQISKFSGATSVTTALAADVVALFSTCSGTQYLGADGACHSGGVGTLTGITTGAGSGLSGGASSGSPSLTLITTCSANQVLAWSGSAWACAAAGTGTVTSVTGTANQVSVATGTSTPAISLTGPLNPPGDVQLTASNQLSWLSQSLGLSADSNVSTLDVGAGTVGDTTGQVNAASYTATSVNAGSFQAKPGNGTCPTPTVLNFIICNNSGTGNVSVSQNGGAYAGLPVLGSIPFDSTNLSAPTTNGNFAYPQTNGLNLTGTQPSTTSSTGTNAGNLFSIVGPTGGNTTGSSTTAGTGGSQSTTLGAGGSGAGGTNAEGGIGGGLHITTGDAGASIGTANNNIAGDVEITAGSAGTGGSGTAGRRGRLILDQKISNAITNSPAFDFRSTYEATAGPTYANNDWLITDVEQSSTVNGNTTLTYTQSGSTGTAAVSVPNLIVTTPTAHTVGIFEGASPMVGVAGSADQIFMGTATDPAFTNAPSGGTNGCSGTSDVPHYNSSTHLWSCGTISGSGTVNTGTAGHIGYYATSTTAISDMGADFTFATHTLSGGASSILNLGSAPPTTGLLLPSAAGAAPTADGQIAFNTTTHALDYGVNGTTGISALAVTGAGNTATTCSNQFISAVSGIAAPTCTTITLASAAFANQGTTTTVLHGNGAGNPSWTSVGSSDLASSLSLTTPNIGAATGTSLLATGIVDGQAPITITTGTTANLGSTYKSGYTFNQEATAGTGVTYTLPATAAGLQYCVSNSGTTGVVNTGVLTVYPPASSFVINKGVVNTVGGGGTHGVASGGAAGDAACFVAIDATHWQVFVGSGTWTSN